MRYVIVGAGSIGGSIGAELHLAGRDVVLVARGAHLEALRAGGLVYATPRGAPALQIPAVAGPDEVELAPDDVMVLAVKTQDTVGALDAWAGCPVAGGGTASERLPLVCAQNGVENERMAARVWDRVIAAALWLPAAHTEPGVVVASGAPLAGIVRLGSYPRGVLDGVAAVAADLAAARFDVEASQDVMRWKWSKLVTNLSNTVDALLTPGDAKRAIARAAAREGLTVLAAARIEVATRAEHEQMRGVLAEADVPGRTRGGSSTWQSMARGRPLETDYLNGEIALLARQHGVGAPVNSALQRWARAASAAGSAPRSLDSWLAVAELRAAGVDLG